MWFLNLIEAFEKARLAYAVAGGYALVLHGAIRGTIDLDLLIELTEPSFLLAEKILVQKGFSSRLPVSAREVFQFRKEYIENRNLIAWSFYDPKNPIRQVDIIITEDLKKSKTDAVLVRGTKIKVASIESLVEMKKRSGRPQDLEDIKALKEIQRREK